MGRGEWGEKGGEQENGSFEGLTGRKTAGWGRGVGGGGEGSGKYQKGKTTRRKRDGGKKGRNKAGDRKI